MSALWTVIVRPFRQKMSILRSQKGLFSTKAIDVALDKLLIFFKHSVPTL